MIILLLSYVKLLSCHDDVNKVTFKVRVRVWLRISSHDKVIFLSSELID